MIGTNLAITTKNYAAGGAVAYDADALAFFTAASITDTTQKNAVNQLVLDLKSASIWTKMKALYPIVGGVASSHAVNLKTPGTYNLIFQTGWTHASTGMTPNGATYANTSLIPSTAGLGQNSTHFSYYSRTNTNIGADMGATYVTGDAGITYMYIRENGYSASRINSTGTELLAPNTNGTGMYISSRISSTGIGFFKNTTKSTVTVTSTGVPTRVIEIGATVFNSTRFFGSKECAFSSIGDGLTDAEASSFYTAVQTFQTTLNRQIP